MVRDACQNHRLKLRKPITPTIVFTNSTFFFFSFVLDSCTIELDLTIVDRICALLNPQPICIATKPQRNVWAQENSATQQVESFIDVKLSCNCLSIKLRWVGVILSKRVICTFFYC